MSPFWGHLIGVVTLVLMATFIGIWIWAWRPRHRPLFDKLAQIPMHDHGEPQDGALGMPQIEEARS
jgi:cytochrome c oxidase cbb3-type subunit 4